MQTFLAQFMCWRLKSFSSFLPDWNTIHKCYPKFLSTFENILLLKTECFKSYTSAITRHLFVFCIQNILIIWIMLLNQKWQFGNLLDSIIIVTISNIMKLFIYSKPIYWKTVLEYYNLMLEKIFMSVSVIGNISQIWNIQIRLRINLILFSLQKIEKTVVTFNNIDSIFYSRQFLLPLFLHNVTIWLIEEVSVNYLNFQVL